MNGKRYSIRRRLVSWTLAALVFILGGIGLAAHEVARHESDEIFSARLAASARVLEALAARQIETATITRPIVITLPPEVTHAIGDRPRATGHPYENKIAFQIWDEQGRLLVRSASAPEDALSPLEAGFSRHVLKGEVWQVFVLRSGRVWVVAAEKDEVRQEMARELGTSILMPLLVGGALMLLIVNFVLSFNMRSLRALAERISDRDPESLAQIELSKAPDELVPIIHELNDLLRRVKAAFEREQRFMDAAAHEIRTPLAALQLHMQNAIRAADVQERDNCLAEAMMALHRTTHLAEQLLVFSRLTAKADVESFENVALDQLCREVIALQEPLLEARGQSIGLDAPEAGMVTGDRHKLQRLLQNLIDNASQHGAPDGDIEVSLAVHEGRVLLQVSNDGEPIPASEIERIFTPYYRLPGRCSQGSGLGLAMVKEIAEQHRAEVTVRPKIDGRGVVMTASFPEVRAA